MARVNCDPYTAVHYFALVNRVTCLLDSQGEVDAAVKALEENGVASDDINIFTGEQGAKCLDLLGREHGRAFWLLRTLEAAMGHEGETNQRIDEALRKGAALVGVQVHLKHKADEKARALKVFKQVHAHEIHYWGSFHVEDVASA
jgi:hypothetical protein